MEPKQHWRQDHAAAIVTQLWHVLHAWRTTAWTHEHVAGQSHQPRQSGHAGTLEQSEGNRLLSPSLLNRSTVLNKSAHLLQILSTALPQVAQLR